jgi:integration host factor subunit beta
LASREGLTGLQAYRVVDLIFGGFKNALANGERIEIRGFGNFVTRDYGAYPGRNPRTGERVEVEAKRLPYFKAGKELKDRMNGVDAL